MRLLVSVVTVDEVVAALEGGADVVDVKQPAEGSLGAPQPAELHAIRPLVAPPVELSAALGDAPHLPGTFALAAAGAAACGVDYVKVGLLGSRTPRDALALLEAVQRAVADASPRARVVAVAYADSVRVDALAPESLPAVAREAGIHGAMLDTAVKDGTSAFQALGEEAIGGFLEAARAAGLLAGLAGSLSVADLPRARELGAGLVGVRGAACDGGRDGVVIATRVRSLRAALGLSAPLIPSCSPAPAAPAGGPVGGR